MADFILYDEYIAEMSTFFKNTSEKADMQLCSLVERLNSICQTGIMEGNRAEELKAFTERAASLQSLIKEYGTVCSNLMMEFLDKIDDIDRVR